jgi:hypothetical protein
MKTPTLKFQKYAYQIQGFDPDKCHPDSLWYSLRGGMFQKLTRRVFKELTEDKVHSNL